MVAIALLLSSIFVARSWATPLPSAGLRIPHIDPQKVLCQLPILKKFLCPATGTSALTRSTALGLASGTLDPSGASRFVVKYANANRWTPSTVVSSWNLPSGSTNASAMPLACPQDNVDSSAFSEDCLSMVIYVPPSLTPVSQASTLLWIHGGSFIVGSASAPGLDGSNLAIATESIVAVVQYRLGALGFLSPDGTTNLAVKDIVSAMQFLKTVVPSFGGSPSKITLAGQSSGASMIRALLAVPSASSLFRSAILQSDPMDYGFLAASDQTALVNNFNGLINCGATDASCKNSLSLDAILNAQSTIYNDAPTIAPAAGNFEPMRPVRDGSFITTTLDSTSTFPSVSKPLLVTSVLQEAGFAIYGNFPDPVSDDLYPLVCQATFGSRTNTIMSSSFYTSLTSADGTIDRRIQLQAMGTDYLWKCSGWTFAKSWVANGGTVFVGEYVIGSTYPGNEAVPYCTQSGVVCHQDDIEIVFGTVSNPSSAQATLITQMQKRYKAFLATGNPNTSGVPTWTAATASNAHALQLGGSGEAAVGACVPTFWGAAAQYDYQFYNI